MNEEFDLRMIKINGKSIKALLMTRYYDTTAGKVVYAVESGTMELKRNGNEYTLHWSAVPVNSDINSYPCKVRIPACIEMQHRKWVYRSR